MKVTIFHPEYLFFVVFLSIIGDSNNGDNSFIRFKLRDESESNRSSAAATPEQLTVNR